MDDELYDVAVAAKVLLLAVINATAEPEGEI